MDLVICIKLLASKIYSFVCPFRAYGIISDEEICNMILLDTNKDDTKKMLFNLKGSIVDAMKF